MDALTLVAELVKALAWPVTALLVVFVLRTPLAGLVPLVRRLKYKDAEVEFGEFGEKLLAVEVKADQAQLPQPEAAPFPLPEPEMFGGDIIELAERLAPISPRAAVIEAWTRVEGKLRRMEGASDNLRPLTLNAMVRNLVKRGTLSETAFTVFEDLRVLRNRVAHSEEPAVSVNQALEYARLAQRLLTYLDMAVDH